MGVPRSRVLVGRDAEFQELTAALAGAKTRGRMVCVGGQAGVGKSRLVGELVARARPTVPVLVGRAVGDGPAQAFRPFAEALQAGLRAGAALPGREVDPFRPALGRLLPQWRAPADTFRSPAAALAPADGSDALGEGVVRLLRALAADTGLLLVLEDLHWADSDSLEVLEYLADNVVDTRALVVVTVREALPDSAPLLTSAGPARPGVDDLLGRIVRRGSARRMDLEPLGPTATRDLVRACLDHDPAPATLAAVERRSGGVPLLVEELLGSGVPDDVVPRTVADAVAQRVGTLAAAARDGLELAAVIGERFDWEVLEETCGDARAEVLATLRAGVRAELLVVRPDGGFAFRHALVRDAVLARVLPPERAAHGEAALRAVRRLHPDLPGAWCHLAAQLAHTSGDHLGAAGLLLDLGRRDLARGALRAAEDSLRRAVRPGLPDELTAEIVETLADVLVEAGRPEEATAAHEDLLAVLARLDPDPARIADAHLRVARAWTVAGGWDRARAHAHRARAGARHTGGVDLVEALVAVGENRFEEARRLATAAWRSSGDHADHGCEALLVLGRIARRTDLTGAEDLFTHALRLADDHDLPTARLHALHELATLDLFGSLRVDRAVRARDEAARAGAVALTGMAEYHLASIRCWRGEYEESLALLGRAEDTARALRLPVLAMVLVMQAEVHAQSGRGRAAADLAEEATRLSPDDPHVRAAALHSRATTLLLAEDRGAALAALDAAAHELRTHDVATTWGPPLPRWALVAALDRPAAAARAGVAELPGSDQARWTIGHLACALAIERGRDGDPVGAATAFARGDHALAHPVEMPHFRRLARRLVVEAALVDGWGDPVSRLREDTAWFEAAGHETVARACRALLRRAGAPVSRRTPGPPVPVDLRGRHVTGREMEVLGLVGAGLTNPEIAERLVLSRRTVEKHLANLLRKTRCADRAGLVGLATRSRPDVPLPDGNP